MLQGLFVHIRGQGGMAFTFKAALQAPEVSMTPRVFDVGLASARERCLVTKSPWDVHHTWLAILFQYLMVRREVLFETV